MTARLTLASTTVRADLDEQAASLFNEHWPEFIFHDADVKLFWARRGEYFADWDFYALDEGRLVGAGYGVPLHWDGTPADLPGGYTDALRRSVTEHEDGTEPNTLVVMGAMVRKDEGGRGWASRDPAGPARGGARTRARLGHRPGPPDPEAAVPRDADRDVHGLDPRRRAAAGPLGADARPARGVRAGLRPPVADDHRLGRGVGVLDRPRAARIGGLRHPRGAGPADVDREADTGVYHEPNIWMRHV